MGLYKNNTELAAMVAKELRLMASDFVNDDDKLEDYWDFRTEQYDFKIWSRELVRKHADMMEKERLKK